MGDGEARPQDLTPTESASGERITAPFTDEQVRVLNRYQHDGLMHPFTCAREHESHVLLVASTDGWWCPVEACDYTQAWAHAFMADETWMDGHFLNQRSSDA